MNHQIVLSLNPTMLNTTLKHFFFDCLRMLCLIVSITNFFKTTRAESKQCPSFHQLLNKNMFYPHNKLSIANRSRADNLIGNFFAIISSFFSPIIIYHLLTSVANIGQQNQRERIAFHP